MRFPIDILRKCWFLVGPTACGKSDVGIELAKALDGEIVSLDSMTVYRGMDIGTAKPTLEMRRRVAHHLIDVIEPHEQYSVADYLDTAQSACREILDRGRTPIFVGGTGLYLRSLLRGIFNGPQADWDLRRRLKNELAVSDPGSLHKKLQDVDGAAAAALHPNDWRRVIRALEVNFLTGEPLSAQQQQHPLPADQRPRHVYWLHPARDWLYSQINRRVTSMMDQGLLEEVRGLLARKNKPGRTSRQALGYKEIIEHLQAGTAIEETVANIQTRTRQFAKRQHTWFRNLEECTAIDLTGDESAEEICENLLLSE